MVADKLSATVFVAAAAASAFASTVPLKVLIDVFSAPVAAVIDALVALAKSDVAVNAVDKFAATVLFVAVIDALVALAKSDVAFAAASAFASTVPLKLLID